MFDPKQPLWLPRGSVRAILAIALTGVICGLAAVGTVSGDAFLAVQASVIAFYFGTKANTTK